MSDAFKERMIEGLGSGDSPLRIERKHFHHEVNSLLRCIWDKLVQRCRHKFGESKSHASCQLISLRPLSLRRASQDSTGFVDLVSFIIAGKKRPEHVIFGHHRPTGKYVDRGIIVSGS